jgi:hypothetical protein
MSYVSGSYKTGALYRVQTTLPSGNHTYYFVFNNNQTAWADPFAPSVYQGPNIGASAKAIKPGTIIINTGSDSLNDPGTVLPGLDGVGYDPG